jgi:DNA-binding transcriptional MerR regulator
MAVVERFTGLTRRRIRYYEQVGLVHPSRTGGGHRLYSPENVDTLLRIKALVEGGIATMEAVRRMMAAGFDRRDPLEAKDSTRRWALQPENMGDAAMRVMRPMDIPNSRPSAVPETDSPSYFRRFTVLPKA